MAKGVMVHSPVTNDLTFRGQVDLTDMQSEAYESCKWICVYQYNFTKFVVLLAVTSVILAKFFCIDD